MRVKVDTASDTPYFRLDEARITDSEEIRPGVILDYDSDRNVVGVEFLRVSMRASKEELSTMQFKAAL